MSADGNGQGPPAKEARPVATLTKKDFASDQEVRWCPGCGDYAILSTVESFLPEMGIPPHKTVFVSGIVERTVIPETPVRVEYSLTKKGRALAAAVEAISEWAHKWGTAPAKDGKLKSGRAK